MTWTVTVRRSEAGLEVEFPEELVAQLGLKEGDSLHLVERGDGFLLTPDPEHTEAMEEFRVAPDRVP